MFRLDRFITISLFNPFKSLLPPPKGIRIPILMYHSISDEPESGHPYFWLNTSAKRFAEHMQFLRDNNYKVIDLSEAVKMISTESSGFPNLPTFHHSSIPQKMVVLTFDDGFQDFLKHAWPVMAEFGFPVTVFVPTAFVCDSRKAFNGRECLTWSEIRELGSYGVSFGSHSVNHSTLYGLPWEEVRRELLDSRLRLEDELQAPAICFAYPYAFPQEDRSFVLRFRQELIDQGYLTAVTTAIGRARRGCDPLCLERLPVNEGDDQELFEAKLAGAYDWLAEAQAFVRRMKCVLRRDRPFNA